MEEEVKRLIELGLDEGLTDDEITELIQKYYEQRGSIPVDTTTQEQEPVHEQEPVFGSFNLEKKPKPKSNLNILSPFGAITKAATSVLVTDVPRQFLTQSVRAKQSEDLNEKVLYSYLTDWAYHNDPIYQRRAKNPKAPLDALYEYDIKRIIDKQFGGDKQKALDAAIQWYYTKNPDVQKDLTGTPVEQHQQALQKQDQERRAFVEKTMKDIEALKNIRDIYLKDIPQTFAEAKKQGALGIATNIASNTGQFVGQILPSIGTLGLYTYVAEASEAYDEMLNNKAQRLTQLTGETWTPERVAAEKLDKEALQYSESVGLINMALEYVSLGTGAFAILRRIAKPVTSRLAKHLSKKLLQTTGGEVVKAGALTGSVEGLTETLQEISLIYQSALAAGKNPEEALEETLNSTDRLFEAWWAGTTGGIVLGGAGRGIRVAAANQQQTGEPDARGGKPSAPSKQNEAKSTTTSTPSIDLETFDEVQTPDDGGVAELTKREIKPAATTAEQTQVQPQSQPQIAEQPTTTAEPTGVTEGGATTTIDPVVKTDNKVEEADAIINETMSEASAGQNDLAAIEAEEAKLIEDIRSLNELETKRNQEKQLKKQQQEAERQAKKATQKAAKQQQKTTKQAQSQIEGAEQTAVQPEAVVQPQKEQQATQQTQPQVTVDQQIQQEQQTQPQVTTEQTAQQESANVVQEQPTVNEQQVTEQPVSVQEQTGTQEVVTEPQIVSDQQVSEQAVQPQETIEPKRRGRPKKIEATPTESVSTQVIEGEANRLRTIFENRKNLKKPSQKLQRLVEFRDKTLPRAKYTSQEHTKLAEEVNREIEQIEQALAERESKRVSRGVEKTKQEQATQVAETIQDEAEQSANDVNRLMDEIQTLNYKKKQIVSKYEEKRSKTGQVLARAIPQERWDQNDLNEVRKINEEIKALEEQVKNTRLQEQQNQKIKELVDKGMPEDVAREFVLYGGDQSNTTNAKKSNDILYEYKQDVKKAKGSLQNLDEVLRPLENFEEVTVEQLLDGLKKISEPVYKLISGLVEFIDRAVKITGVKLRFIQADVKAEYRVDEDAAGGFVHYLYNAETKQTTMYVVLTRTAKTVAAHEIAGHLIHFLINIVEVQLENTGLRPEIDAFNDKLERLYEDAMVSLLNFLNDVMYKLQKNVRLTPRERLILINLFNSKATDNQLSTASGLQYSFTVKDIEDLYKALSDAHLYEKYDAIKKLLYAMSDYKEFLAEMVGNPAFFTAMSYLEASEENIVTETTNIKRQWIQKFVDNIIDIFSKFFSQVLPKIIAKPYDKVLINQLADVYKESIAYNTLQLLQNHLESVEDGLTELENLEVSDDENSGLGSQTIAQKPVSGQQQSQGNNNNNPNPSQVINKLYQKAFNSGVRTEAEMQNFINQTEQSLKTQLPTLVKRALLLRVKRRLKLIKNLDTLKKRIQDKVDDLLSKRIGITPTKSQVASLLMEIDHPRLNDRMLRRYAKMVSAFLADDNVTMGKHYKAIVKLAAQERVLAITKKHKGFQFKEFKKLLGTVEITNYLDFPTFINAISKWSSKWSGIMHKYFHDGLAQAYKETVKEIDDFIETLNALALENKLTEKSFHRIYLFGQLLVQNPMKPTTLEENYKKLRADLYTELEAVRTGALTNVKEEDVIWKIQQLDEIYQQLSENKNPLTKAEYRYYKEVRKRLDQLEEIVRDLTEIVHNKPFISLINYLPSMVVGSTPVKVGNATVGALATEAGEIGSTTPLTGLLSSLPSFNQMSIGQSKFTLLRTGGRGVYYNTNIHTVIANYMQNIALRYNMTTEVNVLNDMFVGNNVVKLMDVFGVRNTRRILLFLQDAVEAAARFKYNVGDLTKAILNIKNSIVEAKVGFSLQFVNQLLSMIPAIAAQTGLANTKKAVAIYLSFISEVIKYGGPVTKEAADIELLLRESANHDIRNFLLEKFESPEDVAKLGYAGKVKRARYKTGKAVTSVLRRSDRAAYAINYLASLIEQGVDPYDDSTWSKKAISRADERATTLQNVSTTLFMPKNLRQNDANALTVALLWAFRSFQLHASLNMLLSAPYLLKEKNARRTFMSHLVSAAAFTTANMTITKPAYVAAGLGLLGLMGIEAPPPTEDPEKFSKWLVDVFFSSFFGFLPALADTVTKYVADAVIESVTGKKSNIIYDETKINQELNRSFGLVIDPIIVSTDIIDYLRDSILGKPISKEQKDRLLVKSLVQILYLYPLILPAPVMPRGDIAKALQNAWNERQRRRKRYQKLNAQRNKR